MCYICGSAPHNERCPFYSDASTNKCSVCGKGIYRGQSYFDLKNEQIHYKCIKDLSSLEILDVLEIQHKVSD